MTNRFNNPGLSRRVRRTWIEDMQVPGDALLLLHVVEVPPVQSPAIPDNEAPAHRFLLPQAVAEDLHAQLGLALEESPD